MTLNPPICMHHANKYVLQTVVFMILYPRLVGIGLQTSERRLIAAFS